MCKIINFFGSPGSGKSLRAAETFVTLKKSGYNAELSREYAKEKVYERNNIAIACEPLIMANELYNIEKLIDAKVEYIICDCPLLIPSFYNKTRSKTFELFALELFNQFNNVNFFLRLNKKSFKSEGRIHTLEESSKIEKKMLNFLGYYDIPFSELEYDQNIDTALLHNNGIITLDNKENYTNTTVKPRICPSCGLDERTDGHMEGCLTRWGRRGWRVLGEYDT